jgi:D-glycero-D-manno-heptose 1,7-bisphosphate phosphatase
MSRTLFLDRDGVINARPLGDYVKNRSELVILPDFLAAVPRVFPRFSRVVVVTNQQGIAKGVMSITALDDIHDAIAHAVATAGGKIDGFFYCPHLADAFCDCRKPQIGLALQAKTQFPDIDFARAVMVGDTASDMTFARRLGMRAVWMETEGEAVPDRALFDQKICTLDDLLKDASR